MIPWPAESGAVERRQFQALSMVGLIGYIVKGYGIINTCSAFLQWDTPRMMSHMTAKHSISRRYHHLGWIYSAFPWSISFYRYSLIKQFRTLLRKRFPMMPHALLWSLAPLRHVLSLLLRDSCNPWIIFKAGKVNPNAMIHSITEV
jgi:hypothetical protein